MTYNIKCRVILVNAPFLIDIIKTKEKLEINSKITLCIIKTLYGYKNS